MHITDRKQEETGRMYALRILKANIVSTELEPGKLLSEKEIAGRLGLSRTPVREAIAELSQSKILDVIPQRGSCVSLIDMELVEEASFLRRTIEEAVIKLVCDMAKPEDLLELESNLRLQEFYAKNPGTGKFMELDNKFHESFFRICNKMQCYNMVTAMEIHFDRVRQLVLNVYKEAVYVEEHRAIFDAVRDRDQEKAVKMMHNHLTRFKIDEAGLRKNYPQYFKN